MTTLLIRNLEDSVYEDIKATAKAKGRPTVAEARDRLEKWAVGLEDL